MQVSNTFGIRGNTISLSINFACSRYHHLPSPFPGKKLKAVATAKIWKINWTVPCIFTAAYICYKLECTITCCHITCATICQMRKHTTPTQPQLTNSDKLWVLATLRLHGWPGRDGFQVHCRTVLGARIFNTAANSSPRLVPQCTWKPSRPGHSRNLKVENSYFVFLRESMAKVLTNQSAPFTKARNQNKQLGCIKAGNGPSKQTMQIIVTAIKREHRPIEHNIPLFFVDITEKKFADLSGNQLSMNFKR